jgi:hypothetical protein
MYKYEISAMVLITAIIISCNKKTDLTTGMNNENNIPKINYVINTSLSSSDYFDIEGYFPKDGLVSRAEIAFQIAEPILNDIYGKEHIEKEKPFSINLENDIWIIEGHLEKGLVGGVAYMEIRKSNGEVLKVCHGK